MDSSTGHKKLSTSALARELGIDVQQLFSTLKSYGWIKKIDEGWALTGKGEFEGGEYVFSRRFGRYIVWPPELVNHPLLDALEDNRRLTAAVIGKRYDLTARETNRLLAELGWIKSSPQGWELTAEGAEQGGLQLENEQSGTFYAVWPAEVDNNAVLKRQMLGAQAVHISHTQNHENEDLFEPAASLKGIDGHEHASAMQLQVCHWLYLVGIAHSCDRQLPTEEILKADFYLPRYRLYIECWTDQLRGAELAEKMRRKTFYEEAGLAVIDVENKHLSELDDFLTRQLRRHGIRVI